MAVTRLAFKLQDGDNYIDLAKQLSIHHRTLIRQKQTFTVLGGMIVDNVNSEDMSAQASFDVSTAPNTWYVRAAVNRCFRAWKNMRAKTIEANADGGSTAVGKYADFKVLLNNGSVGSYLDAIATGTPGSRHTLESGEWTMASVKDESGSAKQFQIVGNHSGARYAALKGWVETRGIPQDYNGPIMPDLNADGSLDYTQDFLMNLYDDDADDRREELVFEENDGKPFNINAPYANLDNQNSLQMQCFGYLSGTNPTQMIPGFDALCGLVKIRVDNEASSPILFLDVESNGRGF
jgi:hypothetical protein